ncbi:MAG: protein-disulfide reductase DsbD family protein [Burkholderiales bacterium]
MKKYRLKGFLGFWNGAITLGGPHVWPRSLDVYPWHGFCFLLALLFLLPGSVWARLQQTDHAIVELVAERGGVHAGQSVQVGLSLTLKSGWHTYWRNPGDSGLPTTLEWNLPPGSHMAAIDWPAPERIEVGPLVSFGYEGEVLLPLTFTAPASARPGDTLRLHAQARWLVCKDVCIPESAALELKLPVLEPGNSAPSTSASPAFASHAASQGLPLKANSLELLHQGRHAVLMVTPPQTSDKYATPPLPLIHVFPYPERLIEPAQHEVYQTPLGYAIKLMFLPDAVPPEHLEGVLVSKQKLDGEVSVWGNHSVAAEFKALVKAVAQLPSFSEADRIHLMSPAPSAGFSLAANTSSMSLWAALGLALVGGMILNLMPCVFPVLSIKLLSLARNPQKPSLFKYAMSYSTAVVFSFLALGGALLLLREAGRAVGWGFQLQEPSVVFGLAVLFSLIGLNLLGTFDVSSIIPRSLAMWRTQSPVPDAFASGVLAVLAATPCTAPFMGAALGFALTQSTGWSLLVFGALGLGMALPYSALILLPQWRDRLPSPGMWMVRLKQGLAFPMFATVVWLIWVLGQQSGIDAAGKGLLSLVGISWVAWMMGAPPGSSSMVWLRNLVLTGVFVGLLVWSSPQLPGRSSQEMKAKEAQPDSVVSRWLEFNEDTLSDHLARGHTVFIDFTAAWCVTCQVNKLMVLNSSRTLQDFSEAKVVLMRADWTDRNPNISAALARLGRSGVPVYALFRPGKPPLLLPELLTAKLVREALQAP